MLKWFCGRFGRLCMRDRDFGRKTSTKLAELTGEYSISFQSRDSRTPLSIVFAFVATHNHFVLDRGGKVFKQSAPVIKLLPSATEDDHLALLGLLNSSTACFWMKQVCSYKEATHGRRWSTADETVAERSFEFSWNQIESIPTSCRTGSRIC